MALNLEGGQEMEARMAAVHFPRSSKSLLEGSGTEILPDLMRKAERMAKRWTPKQSLAKVSLSFCKCGQILDSTFMGLQHCSPASPWQRLRGSSCRYASLAELNQTTKHLFPGTLNVKRRLFFSEVCANNLNPLFCVPVRERRLLLSV